MRSRIVLLGAALVGALAWLPAGAAGLDGIIVYETRCAPCHDNPQERMPTRAQLETRTPEEVIAALTTGVMRPNAEGLDRDQIVAVAQYLTVKDLGTGGAAGPEQNPCAKNAFVPGTDGTGWNGWGRDLDNSRFQPKPGLAAADVPRLELAWAYAYRGTRTYGQPTIVGNRLFATSATGRVYALDPRKGCTHWTFDAPAGVRTAVSVARIASAGRPRHAAFFGDEQAVVYAVDPSDGTLLWKSKVDTHPSARITGAPVFHAGRLYVPLSSAEEGVGKAVTYPCCTFRGSVVALDARTGERIWKSHTIREVPQPYRTNSAGVQLFGPAGGAIWSSPTIDAKRGVLYVGVGNSYTGVPAKNANSVIAMDLATGAHRWVTQTLADDNYLTMCMQPGQANCPTPLGPDYDFGASPILRRLPDGRSVVIGAQKSATVYGFDPQDGRILWQVQAGRGSAAGGIEWGAAADATNVYAAVSDVSYRPDVPEGGLTAVDIATGRRVWHAPAPKPECAWGAQNCSAAQSQAITVIPGVVFSGSVDGHLRAFSTGDGSLVWNYDTARKYDAVNGLPAQGGSLDGGGPVVVDGMVYVNSGYGRFSGVGGNVLLAFRVTSK